MRLRQRTDNVADEERVVDVACARNRIVRLLLIAAILHLSLALTIFLLGRYALFPDALDRNGVAVAFASDGVRYRADAESLSESLKRGELSYWASSDHPFHVKLYSICFAVFGPLLGFNVLGAEPLNLLCYLATLVLLFHIGREIFSRRAGLWASCAVAVWPSFLLHTTQFLRDTLFVAEMLALILILVRWLTKNSSWRSASLTGAAGALLSLALWLTRADMGEMIIATVLLAAFVLIVRQVLERRVEAASLVGIAVIALVTLSVPRLIPNAIELGRSPSSTKILAEQQALHEAPPEQEAHTNLLYGAAARVGKVRRRFIKMYRDAGSNIDGDVQINGAADMLRYLPRAAAIGFFAPFPRMWFAEGKQTGSAGRLLGGAESLAMYAVEALAILGLWRARHVPAAWFLLLVAATGFVALGLVVVNVGALFRLRYVFLMLLIVLAAEGATAVKERGIAG